jgi:hypothetical protein
MGGRAISRAYLLFFALIVLVAVVAQVALAGSGGGPRATESASLTKQVKNLKQRVAALEARGGVPGPTGPSGPLGPSGAVGAAGTDTSAPAGLVSFFERGSCPSGWTELTTARGRYLVGRVAGGTLGGTVGTALTNLQDRPVGRHTHGVSDPGHSHGVTDPGHSHFFSIEQGATDASSQVGEFQDTAEPTIFFDVDQTSPALTGITINSATTGITIDNTGTPGTNAPYLQLLVCKKA